MILCNTEGLTQHQIKFELQYSHLDKTVEVCSSSSSLKWHRKCSLITTGIWNKSCLIPSCYTHSHTRAFALKLRCWLLHDAMVSLIMSGKKIKQNANAFFSCWLFTRTATHLAVKVHQFSWSIRITVSIMIYVIKVINIDPTLLSLFAVNDAVLWALLSAVFVKSVHTPKNTFGQNDLNSEHIL